MIPWVALFLFVYAFCKLFAQRSTVYLWALGVSMDALIPPIFVSLLIFGLLTPVNSQIFGIEAYIPVKLDVSIELW